MRQISRKDNNSKQTVWEHEEQTYRIIGRSRMVRERGYSEPSLVRYNVLQRRLSGVLSIILNGNLWVDVEEEEVPAFAWIAAATLGSADWSSPLFQRCRDNFGLCDIHGEGLGKLA